MFVPARHRPVSLIGLIRILGSCWSSVEEGGREGYSEEEAGVLWQQRDFLGLQKHRVTAGNSNTYAETRTITVLGNPHMCGSVNKRGQRKERVK